MDEYFYYVETGWNTKCFFYRREDAYRYYEENRGLRIFKFTDICKKDFELIIDTPNFDTERIRRDFSLKNTTRPQRKAVRKYDDKNTVQLKCKLNKKTDSDILEFLETLDNKQGFIKELIRSQIKTTDAEQ